MNQRAALSAIVDAFADPDLLRVIDPQGETDPKLVPAAFGMQYGMEVALALADLFDDGIVAVIFEGEAIALHAACGERFFDPFGLYTADELLKGWAEFYVEPQRHFTLRPSTGDDTAHLGMDAATHARAAALRDALHTRVGAAIATLRQ